MNFTKEHLAAYYQNGYVVVRNFFTKEGVDLLYRIALDDDVMSKKSWFFEYFCGKIEL